MDISKDDTANISKGAPNGNTIEMAQAKTTSNSTLERESLGCRSVLLYSSLFLLVDVWKQVTVYGMKHFNGGKYPLPQTQVVTIVESLKCVIFLTILIYTGAIRTVKMSYWYAIPSIIYAFNNNVYMYGLTYTTPPIWNILTQQRIVFTAFVYRFFFKREMSKSQWIGLSMLIAAIIATSFTGEGSVNAQGNLFAAFILAGAGSLASVGGTVTMEYLFKNDKKNFMEMQMQLYLFSSIAALGLFAVEVESSGDELLYSITGDYNYVMGLLVVAVVFGVLSGIAVAFIVKKLDNIVKLYAQALSNMLTSAACAIMFPSKFKLDAHFVGCLGLMTVAIMIYENKNMKMDSVPCCRKEKDASVVHQV